MAYLKAQDTICGKEGSAQVNINGEIHKLFNIKSLEAKMEKDKSEIKTIGSRATQNKTTGWKGTGSMTVHYISSLFRKLSIDYIKTGKDFYFDLIVTNDDANSSAGRQTTALYNCNIDTTILAKLDIDDDALEEELEFTFDDAELLEGFKDLDYLK
ncbi:MAG: phage tail tube protein [Clostridium sp.]|uniref:phage tail tube protein n=1 Tax=Clostridium TaxID=1485 RepID=UPI0018848AF6|nr:phage tail tube protein [Clostridium chrysemydis]